MPKLGSNNKNHTHNLCIPHLQKIPGLKKRELKGFIVQKSFHYHIPYPEADTISHDEDMLSWKQKKEKKTRYI